MNSFTRLSIAAQLIVPFVAISILTTVLLGISNILTMSHALLDALDTTSQTVTRHIANELAEPLAARNFKRMQSVLMSTQRPGRVIYYALVLAADGSVLASTDPAVKGLRLDRDDFEKSALNASRFQKRKTRYANMFETVMPVATLDGIKEGVLIAGFSTSAAQETVRRSALETFVIGVLALLAGIAIYVFIIRRSIIQPITNIARLATKISEGDLNETVYATRNDEIGQLLRAEGEMVKCLRTTASMAESIANGNLSVHIKVRSEADVFGKALEKMVASLNRQTKEIKQLAAIVECSEDAIFSITSAGQIISWNKGAQKLYGYAAADILDNSIELLLVDGDERAFFSMVANVFDNQLPEPYETISLRQDRSSVHVALSVSPVRDETEGVVAVSVIARDITLKKAVEDRVGEFHSIVSHELRTPLTSIRGALGLLVSGIIPAESEEGAELILGAKLSSERLGRLINDILDLRKSETGLLQLNITNVDSTDLVSSAVEVMRGMAKERGVSLWTDFQERSILAADMDRATQVLTNLISNAIKYSESGCAIHVSTAVSKTPNTLAFFIKDQGPGIAENMQHKLFQKFQQIDSSDTRAREGSGLGLAISKAIVEQHGGTIGFQSAVGFGSTFWFELPISEEGDAADARRMLMKELVTIGANFVTAQRYLSSHESRGESSVIEMPKERLAVG